MRRRLLVVTAVLAVDAVVAGRLACRGGGLAPVPAVAAREATANPHVASVAAAGDAPASTSDGLARARQRDDPLAEAASSRAVDGPHDAGPRPVAVGSAGRPRPADAGAAIADATRSSDGRMPRSADPPLASTASPGPGRDEVAARVAEPAAGDAAPPASAGRHDGGGGPRSPSWRRRKHPGGIRFAPPPAVSPG